MRPGPGAGDGAAGDLAGVPPRLDDDLFARALGGGPLAVVDARSASDFEAGHIEGALSVDVGTLRAEVDGVPGQVAAPGTVAAALARAGLDPELTAVVYGASSDLAASRLAWTLALMGQSPVHLLDGGMAAWRAAGRPVVTGPPDAPATEYPDDRLDESLRVDTRWVLDHLGDPQVVLVDARTEPEYEAGHIPGALGLNWQGNVGSDGRLLPLADLQARHGEIPKDATVVAYCQTGSRASMAWFVLTELGYADARLYDGSMAAWTQDPSRPLE